MLVAPDLVFPSPLVGEGGENTRSGFETDEGFASADRDPSPALAARGHPLPQGERYFSVSGLLSISFRGLSKPKSGDFNRLHIGSKTQCVLRRSDARSLFFRVEQWARKNGH